MATSEAEVICYRSVLSTEKPCGAERERHQGAGQDDARICEPPLKRKSGLATALQPRNRMVRG